MKINILVKTKLKFNLLQNNEWLIFIDSVAINTKKNISVVFL
jgi:hypothetical protein